MNSRQFAYVLDVCSRSRRAVVSSLLTAAMTLGAAPETNARKKHRKKRRKKNKKRNLGETPATLPPPVARADATCGATGGASGAPRQAQTFRALRSGQLTSATVLLVGNTAGCTFDVEIWSVDQANAPSVVLAGATIPNVAATAIGAPPRRLTATFAAPATVTAGLRYALVITRTAGSNAALQAIDGNPCPDGTLFFALTANGVLTADPETDLYFETIVTA